MYISILLFQSSVQKTPNAAEIYSEVGLNQADLLVHVGVQVRISKVNANVAHNHSTRSTA